jgi:hypothetical protein
MGLRSARIGKLTILIKYFFGGSRDGRAPSAGARVFADIWCEGDVGRILP